MPEPTDAGTPVAAPAALLDAILAFDLALEHSQLYPASHPLVGSSRDACAAAGERARAALGRIELRVGPASLGWRAGETHDLPGPRCETLGRLLHAMQIVAVTVEAEAEGRDWLSLLDLVNSLRGDAHPVATIRRWEQEAGTRRVAVATIDVAGLQYADRRPGASGGGDTWAGLNRYLAGSETDPALAARHVSGIVADPERSGVGAVRAEIVTRLDRVDAAGDAALCDRIVRLLAALPEPLRAELLRVATGEGSGLLARLVRPLPVREALSTILQLGQVQGELPRGTSAILTQILHCLPDGTSVAEAALGAEDEPVDVASVARALETMFAKRSDEDFTQADYQRRLDELARQENLIVDRSPDRASVLEDAALLAGQAGGIAALTLAEATAEEAPAIVERIDRSLARLLAAGRLDLLAVAARALAEPAWRESAAARSLLDHVVAELGRVFELGTASERAGDDLRSIVLLLPPEAVGRAALERILVGGETAPFERMLRDLEGRQLAGLLRETLEASPRGIGRLRGVLRDAESPEVQALVDELTAHADRTVRAAALAAVVDREGAERHLDMLEEAVLDPDPDNARWALRRLAAIRGGDVDGVARLVHVLRTRGPAVPRETSSRIAALLLRHGEDGVRGVTGVVDALRGVWSLRAAGLARRLAGQLAAHRGDPGVDETLRRWNRSLGRVLAWIPRREP